MCDETFPVRAGQTAPEAEGSAVRSLTSADHLVEVQQQLLPGDHHVLHLRQQVRVETRRVDVDWGHQQGGHQLALHPQTHPAPQHPHPGRQQLAVAPVDGRSLPACLGPVGAQIWSWERDGGWGQRSVTVSVGPLDVCYVIREAGEGAQKGT